MASSKVSTSILDIPHSAHIYLYLRLLRSLKRLKKLSVSSNIATKKKHNNDTKTKIDNLVDFVKRFVCVIALTDEVLTKEFLFHSP